MNLWFPWRSGESSTSKSAQRLRPLRFEKTGASRSVSRTGLFLKERLWIFPIAALLVLTTIGFSLRGVLEQTMRDDVRSELETVLDLEVSMLTTWFQSQEANAETTANDLRVREIVYQLLSEFETGESPTPHAAAQLQLNLKKELLPRMSANEFPGFFLFDKSGRVLASDETLLIGKDDFSDLLRGLLKPVFAGETVILPPYPSRIFMKDEQGEVRSGVPVMMVLAPLRDAQFQCVAAMGFRIRPEQEFTQILQLGRMGNSGETYAFDLEGRMVSNSRFDEQLMMLGLMADEPGSQSILQVQLRDPGGDLAAGYRPKNRRAELPLIKPVEEAIAGRSGSDVSGYRDYRGALVLGAWKVLPKFKIGVATEIDRAEAFRPLHILRWTFWGLLSLLALASLAIFLFSVRMARLEREAQHAALESQKLGQYTLEEKLGTGGMGVVYKGRHAVLRRPTAIKVLDIDRITEASIKRFEREVQITCQLNHPNTVQIYDYGHTPEKLFYYAMEYLDGIDLQRFVERYGPMPEGRVVRILTQICGSLYEAHSLGMVHRDIKPANIMLNRRGGEADVVKVLDFGLVKALDEDRQQSLTAAGSLTGTPLYMSPEAIQTPISVDARSDLYAVGAVGYFLLTGKPVFEAAIIVDLCQLHVTGSPIPPSERLGRPVSAELEAALLACLEKSRSKPPQTARDLAALLQRAPTANSWTVDDAELWWSQYERSKAKSADGATPAAAKKQSLTSSPIEKTFISDS